jgi:hypothetical protein
VIANLRPHFVDAKEWAIAIQQRTSEHLLLPRRPFRDGATTRSVGF